MTARTPTRFATAALALALGCGLVACGSSGGDAASDGTTTTSGRAAASAVARYAA